MHRGWQAGAAILELASVGIVFASGHVTPPLVIALVLHAMATAIVWWTLPAGTRRTLATAWTLCLPGIGLVVASVTVGLVGDGDLQQFDRGQVRSRPHGPGKVVHALAAHVPVVERLVSGVAATRRSALATLASRRDAEAIGVLRWAVCHPDGDLALDAALTLEELTESFEARRAEAENRLAEAPTFEAAIAAGDVVLEALQLRLIEEAVISTFAADARARFAHALALDPTRAPMLTERLARVSLIALRPVEALALLAPAVREPGAGAVLHALYNDAVIAARRFGPALEVRHGA